MGDSYVLGNRNDDTIYKPYNVHVRMFKELPVLSMGCGSLFVTVLAGKTEEYQTIPELTVEPSNS